MNIRTVSLTSRPSPTSKPSIRFDKPGRFNSVAPNSNSFEITSPSNKAIVSPSSPKRTKIKHARYHTMLANMYKEYDGLHLDYEARLQVIRDLKDLDCFSDDGETGVDDGQPPESSDLDGTGTPFREQKHSSLEMRLQIRSLTNYVNRSEDIRERMPTAAEIEAKKNRILTRERNINRAVDIFVRRRQQKNEEHNQQLIAYLKEAASAETQQIRRFAIGVISRIINKAKSDYVLRAQQKKDQRVARKLRKLRAKEMIHRNWRQSRFQKFLGQIGTLVARHREMEYNEAMKDDAAFKQRLMQRQVVEQVDIDEFQKREVKFRAAMYRQAFKAMDNAHNNNNTTTTTSSGNNFLRTKESIEFERLRPDLEPFSGMINRKGFGGGMAPEPALFEDDIMPPIRSTQDNGIRYDPLPRFQRAVVWDMTPRDEAGLDVSSNWFERSVISEEEKKRLKSKSSGANESTVLKTLTKICNEAANIGAAGAGGERMRGRVPYSAIQAESEARLKAMMQHGVKSQARDSLSLF